MNAQRQEVVPANSSFTPVPSGLLQRKCACGNHTIAGGECAECGKTKRFGLQTKLKVNEPGDIYEREADRIADQVMATPAHSSVSGTPPHIQRFAGQPTEQTDAAPASVDQALASPGRPLEPALLKDMEQRFSHDFSRVRVHSGTVPEQSARDVSAHAYTVGHNVVFGAGRFAPETYQGRRLIGHELTHVVQQSGADGIRVGQSNKKGGLSPNYCTDLLEQEASRTETVIMSNAAQPSLAVGLGNKSVLQRQPAQTQPRTEFEGCDPALQNDLRAKHQPALQHVDQAITSLTPGWARMNPTNQSAFRQYFDPANSGDIDEGFVRDVRGNYQRIRSYMGSLRFDCNPNSWTLCGTSNRWCVDGRLMWTCFGNLHVCANAYSSARDPFKTETIIHESVHNALLTTDRAYSSSSGFQQLRPRGGGFFGRLLNFLSNVPVLGLLFRNLPGNNDTINNPDSYAGYAMQANVAPIGDFPIPSGDTRIV